MPTRYTAEMKLAGLAVQSVLMGLYITLVVAMIYLLSRSPASNTKRAANRRAQRLLIIGMVVLSIATAKGAPCSSRYFPYSGYLGLTPVRVEGGTSCRTPPAHS